MIRFYQNKYWKDVLIPNFPIPDAGTSKYLDNRPTWPFLYSSILSFWITYTSVLYTKECKSHFCRAINFWELLGVWNQNMKKKIFNSSFCVCVYQIVDRFKLKEKVTSKKKKNHKFSLMGEILHAWQDILHSWGRFYMLGVRVWEIVSRHETRTQCVIVDSPGFWVM